MSVGLVGFTAREHYRKHSLVVRRVFNHIPLLYTVSVFSTRRGEGTTLARPPFTIDTKTFLNQTHFLLFSSEVMSCARLTFHLETDDTMSGVSMTWQTHADSQHCSRIGMRTFRYQAKRTKFTPPKSSPFHIWLSL